MQNKLTLRAAREKAGLTIGAAAEKIGVNRDTVSRWEHGKTYPNVIQFQAVADVYGVKFEDIEFTQ